VVRGFLEVVEMRGGLGDVRVGYEWLDIPSQPCIRVHSQRPTLSQLQCSFIWWLMI
jgi:hypothetical protein